MAKKYGYKNTSVLASGPWAYAKKYPQNSVYFGEKLTKKKVKEVMIPKSEFKKHLLSPEEFIAKVKKEKIFAIDIRPRREKKDIPFVIPKMTKSIPFTKLVELIKKKSKAVPRKNLMIFDLKNPMVKMLQYFLEKNGITDYYFMKGGVKAAVEQGYDKNAIKK